jgi:flagellar basal-body rod modification protein FlgD
MSTSAIDPTGSSTSSTAQAQTSVLPTKSLGQQDFLNLLVAQLTNQDPLNPQTNTDFVAQMAQFSSLQQATNMQQDIAQMRADSLLGQNVQLQTSSGDSVTGTVSAVNIMAGVPSLIVNGQSYQLNQVTAVVLPTPQTN